MSWHWHDKAGRSPRFAAELGRHPVTVGNWLKNGGPPAKRELDPALLVVDERWAVRITEILKANPNLLGTSVDRLLRAEGFEGSYPTLIRHLREARGGAPPRAAGERADRDHPRRGVPVRLVGLLRLGPGMGPRRAALLRGDPVLEPPPALVVRPVA